MMLKLLACEVLTREVCHAIVRAPHAVTPVFTPKNRHNQPSELRRYLQEQIDQTEHEETAYSAILLGYGLCGNATLGLKARTIPLVVPRAHDCTTLFLGSKERFKEHFSDNPSQSWASVGYSERGDSLLSDSAMRAWLSQGVTYEDLAATYGEENAQYLLDAMQPRDESGKIVLLDVPETREPGMIKRILDEAARSGLEVEELRGSVRLMEMLVGGEWPDEEFLTVPPGHQVAGVYDYDQVITAEPVGDDIPLDPPSKGE